MSHSTGAPTKAESERIVLMLRLGCIITLLRRRVYEPAECHHILDSGRRRGHWFTIPLSPYYHRGVITDREVSQGEFIRLYGASLAHGSKAFEKSHGRSELWLWRIVQRLLKLDSSLPSSKILPRRFA